MGRLHVGDNWSPDITGECTVKVSIQGYGKSVKFKVINLIDGVDAILGEPWLKHHGIHLDYEHDVVRVKRHHQIVTLYPCMMPKATTVVPVPLSAMPARA